MWSRRYPRPRWFERWKPKLEVIKPIVEIVAVVAGGIFAVNEYLDKKGDEQRAGAGLRRANLELSSTAAILGNRNRWVSSKLVLRNPTKNVVDVFLVTWTYYVPVAGEDARLKVKNDSSPRSVAPGEEVPVNHSIHLEPGYDAVIVHADVNFADTRDDLECVIDPSESIPDAGLDELERRPLICARRTGASECATSAKTHRIRGCEGQSIEALVDLTRADTARATTPPEAMR